MHLTLATNRSCDIRANAGFTLLEMSIVLVIIGLVIGGITFGRNILINSRVQTIMTDADNYITATANFKQQFQALPGDMATATAQWGTDSNTCPSGGGSSGTCNGNGDGRIGTSGSEGESFRYWQHLYMAGMSSKILSGIASSSGVYGATIGTNVPPGSVDGSGFAPVWEGTALAADTNFFAGSYGNILIFGATVSGFLTSSPIITTEQAASIDAKIDDGMPATGKVRSFKLSSTYAPKCTVISVTSGYLYSLSSSGNLCSLIFITGF